MQQDMLYADKTDFLRRLGENYSDIQVINAGGGGIIYSAVHRRLGQKVVLKKIRSGSLNLVGKTREIEILQSLKHTYLPRIVDFWAYNEEVYTVMEFIDGKSLQELIDEGRRFTKHEVIKLTKQLTEVLVYLHNSPLHIIHSDIKPANIMLTPEGNICLIDFNISVLQNGTSDETIGYTPRYAPVEQLICYELGKRAREASRNAATASMPSSYVDDRTAVEEGEEDRTAFEDDATAIDDESWDPYRTTMGDDVTDIDDRAENAPPIRSQKVRQIMPQSASQEKPRRTPIAKQLVPPSQIADQLIKKYGKKVRLDARTDIYSACATMYYLLCGRAPQPCYEEQIPIEKLVPDVNEAFEHILEKGMAQDPDKRFDSAAAMLKALDNLARSTRKYRRTRFWQDAVLVLLVLMIAVGGVSSYAGLRMKLISRADDIIKTAYSQYLEGDYSLAEQNLQELLASPVGVNEAQISDAYYIIGSCAMQVGDYRAACEAFQTSMIWSDVGASHYRDYGIALVKIGNTEQAKECLAQAKALGINDDSILLLEAEIKAALGEYDAAAQDFTQCLDLASDPMVLVRAAVELDAIDSKETASEALIEARVKRLEGILTRLDTNEALKFPVYECLAQACIDGMAFDEAVYTKKAIDTLDRIIASGYASVTEYLNKAVCQQSLGEFDVARETLLDAAKKYPSSYLIYKRLAFLEIERQYALPSDARSYEDFQSYYDTCFELYGKVPQEMQDFELDILTSAYHEVVTNGWLEDQR